LRLEEGEDVAGAERLWFAQRSINDELASSMLERGTTTTIDRLSLRHINVASHLLTSPLKRCRSRSSSSIIRGEPRVSTDDQYYR